MTLFRLYRDESKVACVGCGNCWLAFPYLSRFPERNEWLLTEEEVACYDHHIVKALLHCHLDILQMEAIEA